MAIRQTGVICNGSHHWLYRGCRVESKSNGACAAGIAGNVRLTYLYGVGTLNCRKAGVPGRAAINAVLDGCTGFHSCHIECAGIGDAVNGTAAAICRQGD